MKNPWQYANVVWAVVLAGVGACRAPSIEDANCGAESCSGGAVCVAGTCRALCQYDGECAAGEACTGGVCLEGPQGDDTTVATQDPPQNPCEGVTCSGRGSCVAAGGQARCECIAPYVADGLSCKDDVPPPNPCAGVACSGHGGCVVEAGRALCDCIAPYVAEGLTCKIVEAPDPCEAVTCSGLGQCIVQGGAPGCNCTPPYVAEGLSCVAQGCVPTARAARHCEGTSAYWYDSCGARGERIAQCGVVGCSEGYCITGWRGVGGSDLVPRDTRPEFASASGGGLDESFGVPRDAVLTINDAGNLTASWVSHGSTRQVASRELQGNGGALGARVAVQPPALPTATSQLIADRLFARGARQLLAVVSRTVSQWVNGTVAYGDYQVTLHERLGTAWSRVEIAASGSFDGGINPRVALTRAGVPVMAWERADSETRHGRQLCIAPGPGSAYAAKQQCGYGSYITFNAYDLVGFALDAADQPLVAYRDAQYAAQEATPGALRIARGRVDSPSASEFDWRDLGTDASLADYLDGGVEIEVAADGTLWIAYVGGTREPVVKSFDGANWIAAPSVGVAEAMRVSLALDLAGRPVVGANTQDGAVVVKRLASSVWERVGVPVTAMGLANIGGAAPGGSLDVLVDDVGQPVVAWVDTTPGSRGVEGGVDTDWFAGSRNTLLVRRFDGTRWVELGSNPEASPLSASPTVHSSAPAVALDGEQRPIVAWLEGTESGPRNLYLKRWDGSAWVGLGGSDRGGGLAGGAGLFDRPQLVISPSGVITVLWEQASCVGSSCTAWNRELWMTQWRDGSWRAVQPASAAPHLRATFATGRFTRLGATSSGAPLVATLVKVPVNSWSSACELHVWRWSGEAWENPGGAALPNVGCPSTESDPMVPAAVVGHGGSIVVFGAFRTQAGEVAATQWTSAGWVKLSGAPRDVLGSRVLSDGSLRIAAQSASCVSSFATGAFAAASCIALAEDAAHKDAWSTSGRAIDARGRGVAVSGRSGQYADGELRLVRATAASWQALYGSTDAGGLTNTPGNSSRAAVAAGDITCVAWSEAAHGQLGEILLRCSELP